MTQSDANQSLDKFPCYDGKKQGFHDFYTRSMLTQRQKRPEIKMFSRKFPRIQNSEIPQWIREFKISDLDPIRENTLSHCREWAGPQAPVRVEFQFRQQMGCEIRHCNVAARHMTEGLRLAVRVRHCVQPA
jgi:hypothetical protein